MDEINNIIRAIAYKLNIYLHFARDEVWFDDERIINLSHPIDWVLLVAFASYMKVKLSELGYDWKISDNRVSILPKCERYWYDEDYDPKDKTSEAKAILLCCLEMLSTDFEEILNG